MWSYVLGALGVTALFTIGKKKWYGWAMAFTNECLWLVYGWTTKQYGFCFAALAYGSVNAYHGYKWRKAHHGQLRTLA